MIEDLNIYTVGLFEEETPQERDYCQRLMKAITKGNGNYYDVASSNNWRTPSNFISL